MDWTVAAVALCALLAGLLLGSRVLSWLAGLAAIFKTSRAEGRAGSAVAQLFLHSGPWLLALSIGAVYYVASGSHPSLLWAVVGGLCAAFMLLAIALAIAYHRQRRGTISEPLTPERLTTIRRRFFWGTSSCFGGGMAALFLYQLWPHNGRELPLLTIVLLTCLGLGYVFSWFMWQFYGASLQASEDARRRAERKNAA